MARFLYFLPGSVAANLDSVPDGHVRRVLAGGSPVFRGCNGGPNGEPGVVCMAAEKEATAEETETEDDDPTIPAVATVPGFYPDRQTWLDQGEFWLGWETENMPGPEDLLRPRPVGGEPVALGDGREWLVPMLGPAWRDLPGYLKAKPGGGCEVVLRDEYKPLCEESEFWFDVLKSGGTYSLDRFFKFAADALATNYRVGMAEAGALKLIGTRGEDNDAFLVAAIGMRRANEEIKKKIQAGGLPALAGN